MHFGDQSAFDAILANYESVLTHLARRRAMSQIEVMRDTASLLAANARDTNSQAAAQRTQRRERLQRAVHTCEEQIRDLNQAYVGPLTDLLAPDDAQRLQNAYLIRAYPEVWPNPFDVSPIGTAALNCARPDQRDVLEAFVATAQEQARVVNGEMKQRVDRWMNQMPADGTWRPDLFQLYRSDMDDLQKRRRESTDNAITKMSGVFEAPIPQELARAISDFRFSVANRRGQPLGLTYIP